MKLEVLSHLPKTPSPAPPLLFVHGANSGAWIWDVHVLPNMASRGFEAYAVSLRGHGRSDGQDCLAITTLADFVADLDQTVQQLDRLPILIGHSMGGMVVQKYLQTKPAAGAVLMASVPPMGLIHTSLDMAWRNPMLLHQISWIQLFGPMFPGAEATVRSLLFSDAVPAAEVARYMPRWQPESLRATLDMMGWDLPWMPRTTVPMLVLGAENDKFTPPNLVQATALRYGAEMRIIPDMAHAMMLEPRWPEMADAVADWVLDQFADAPPDAGTADYALAAS